MSLSQIHMFEIWRQNHKPVTTSFGDKIQIYVSEKEIANIKRRTN